MPGSSVFSLFSVTQAIADISNKIATTAWVKSLGGSTPLSPVVTASTYSTTGYEDIWCNTASNTVTITLPSVLAVGMKVGVTRTGVNNVIINNNGITINTVLDTLTIDQDKAGVWLIASPSLTNWQVEFRTRG